ncbi:MAG: ABC transporter substrate-binding protein [Oscillospiraceae bacterium]|nr:ABC transporter substrate-binding protein [Oscillospiraceae bacterium]
MKKLIALLLALVMVLSLCACGAKEEAPAAAPAEDAAEAPAEEVAAGSVYYLNFKPEQDEAWQKLAEEYTAATGVPVTVLTAASGTYEETLMAEMGKQEAPTMFQVNGPVGLANWIDYCYDMSGSELYSHLTSDAVAHTEDGAVYGIAYVIESYGIIANKALLAEAGYAAEDINSFETLKAVAEDITARSAELGFAAFSSAGMDSSSDWRFKTHLANLPIYFEYQADGIGTTTEIKGDYLDNYRQIWDLYINNSTCAPAELSAKTGDDSRNEFLNGEAVFFQNGSWEYGSLSAVYSDDDLVMLPIYIGAGDEANQGLCTGTENYWCVNKDASEEDIAATLAFMNWCVTEGAEAMANDMGFVIPFDTAVESPNLFVKQDVAYTAEGKTPVSWNFPTMPSEEWKNVVGSALTAYAADQTDANWDAVVTAFVDGWASEYALLG